jgi:hypothetical protein
MTSLQLWSLATRPINCLGCLGFTLVAWRRESTRPNPNGAEFHRARDSTRDSPTLLPVTISARLAFDDPAWILNVNDRLCFLDMWPPPGPAAAALADQTTRKYKDRQTGS